MVGISTNDGYFFGVVVDLSGKIHHILDPSKYDTIFNIQSFMLDMHPDMVYTAKGVKSNDRHKGAIDLNQIVTWKSVTEGMSATFFVNSSFKCINRNGKLLDSDGIIGSDVNPPQYSEVVEDGS